MNLADVGREDDSIAHGAGALGGEDGGDPGDRSGALAGGGRERRLLELDPATLAVGGQVSRLEGGVHAPGVSEYGDKQNSSHCKKLDMRLVCQAPTP